MKMTQKDRLLKYLSSGRTITPLQSWNQLGIYRLADVVYKLRKDGWNIQTKDCNVKNTFGEKCVVAEYELNPQEEMFE